MSDTKTIQDALAERYPLPKWVLIPEAPEKNIDARRCDALAIGVWGSSHHRIIGHEIKVQRSDWLRELDQPQKADAFETYCDSWYLVATPGVVKLEELRASWGLMELVGKKLKIRKQAEVEIGDPMPRPMMSALMRAVMSRAVAAEVERRMENVTQDATGADDVRVEYLTEQIKKRDKSISDFEAASGVRIGRWDAGMVGQAVKVLLTNKTAAAGAMRRDAARYSQLAEAVSAALKEIEAGSSNTVPHQGD